jgi:hypothetical protein
MLRRLFLASTAAAGLAIGILWSQGVDASHATPTPALCDPTPKYYCSRIDFTRVTGGYTVNSYQHRGAIDGGAKRWRRHYVEERTYPGGAFLYNVPSTSWKTNVSLPTSYTTVTRGVTYYQHIRVRFGFEFYECTSSCYSWWGDTYQILLAT